MPTSVNVAGTWRNIGSDSLYTRVSGTWRSVDTGYVKVSGSWMTFYQRDQIAPGAVTGSSAAFNSPGSGTSVTASWTNPSDADMSFVRVEWYINAPGSPVSSVDVAGTASQARTATFTTTSVTSNIYVRLTPYDTSGNAGATVEIGPSAIKSTAPQSFGVSTWSYSSVQLTWTAPLFGTANSYTVEQRNSVGSLISSVSTTLTNYSFPVSEDTNYQFFVIAVSTGGTTSTAALRVAIGHSETGYYQAVYDWSSSVSSALIGSIDYVTSTNPGYPASNLNDATGSTQWRSAGWFTANGWEGFKFQATPGGNRKLKRITVNGERQQLYYLSLGGIVNPGINMGNTSGFGAYPNLNQSYITSSPESTDPATGVYVKTLDVDAYEIVLSSLTFIQVAVTNMPYVTGNYKAVVSDVFIDWRERVQTGSNWIVTRTALANGYW